MRETAAKCSSLEESSGPEPLVHSHAVHGPFSYEGGSFSFVNNFYLSVTQLSGFMNYLRVQ